MNSVLKNTLEHSRALEKRLVVDERPGLAAKQGRGEPDSWSEHEPPVGKWFEHDQFPLVGTQV